MSVILKFSICEGSGCNSLTFKELTGIYDSVTNPNGWGTPNRDISTATAATLTITNPTGGIYIIDLFATGLFPTNNNTVTYTIPLTSIGLTTVSKIPDGIYILTYSVTTLDTTIVTYTQTIKQAFYCQVKCCVESMFLGLDVTCDCAKNAKTKAIDAWLLLKGLIFTSGNGCSANFNDDLATLQKMCLNKNCKNCK